MRLIVSVLAALILPASMASATVTVSVMETGTGNPAINVSPGGTFSVDVFVSESNEGTGITGVQLSLDSAGPASDKIAVAGPADGGGTSAALNGAEWDADITATGTGLPLPVAPLSVTPVGAGYTANGGKLSGSVTPSSRLMTVEMSVAADAPDGAYTVSAAGLAFPDFAGSIADIVVTPGSGLTVNVSPPGGVFVVNRQLFYGNSAWGTTPVPSTPGVAGNKVAKLPGTGPATFENVSSHSRGINGIYIDVQGLSGTPTAADFAFKCGNTTTIASWSVIPPDPTISVLAGQGDGGSDRIQLVWSDNAIPNKNWLEVTVKATAATGLTADDVFYFGSLVGETGDTFAPATRWTVTSTDYNAIYTNRSTSPILNRTITDVYDIDRSKNVNSTDYNTYGYNARGLSPVDGLIVVNP